jgi:hypothetical protein
MKSVQPIRINDKLEIHIFFLLIPQYMSMLFDQIILSKNSENDYMPF